MISQIELVAAILKELNRQQLGVCASQAGMNAVIQAADLIKAAQGEFTVPGRNCDD